mmetsp:Transcript_10014/g.36614  ORF Transcript_10014/g.36614 Transcript_10014/m.36614 type:complete len:140 (-) Transcript_10014:158-577(-)
MALRAGVGAWPSEGKCLGHAADWREGLSASQDDMASANNTPRTHGRDSMQLQSHALQQRQEPSSRPQAAAALPLLQAQRVPRRGNGAPARDVRREVGGDVPLAARARAGAARSEARRGLRALLRLLHWLHHDGRRRTPR